MPILTVVAAAGFWRQTYSALQLSLLEWESGGELGDGVL